MNKKIEILKILKKRERISGQEIAESLRITRSDVHKHITSLRKSGYKIDAKRNLGYILRSAPEIKSYLQLEFALKEKIEDTLSIKHFKTLDSTQIFTKKLADKNAPRWSIVVADTQTAGYGRLKRSWSSDLGGLWFSVLLRPKIEPSSVPSISLVISLSVAEAIKKTSGIDCLLKWPNDIVYIENKKMLKIAGIITEMSTDVESINWVIVGCGINVNNKIPTQLKRTAANLKSITNKKISPVELLKNFLTEFKSSYDKFVEKGFGVFKDAYNKKCILIGKEVNIISHTGEDKGIALGVDDEGRLILESDGKKLKVVAGDASVREY